jgi:AcrR family transcriptional regulator
MTATQPRRKPVQQRSLQNVEKILEATSRVLARQPLAEVTTTQIAQEAGISIGGLYRFFPDKQALIDAVAIQRIDDFAERLNLELLLSTPTDPLSLLSEIVDRYIQFLDAHPDFRQIALGRYVSATAREKHVTANTGITGIVRRFLVEQLGGSLPRELDLRLTIANQVGESLITFAYEQPDSDKRREVIEEMKRLLAAYLFSGNA